MFGIYNHPDASRLSYFGLYAQQHRGQEGAGITVWDGKNVREHRALGLVSDIFSESTLKALKGQTAIGAVLYSSKGNLLHQVEPFIVRRRGLELAITHDGALVNSQDLRAGLEADGAIFQTSTDSEIFAHLIVRRLGRLSLEEAVIEACAVARGTYSLLIMANDRLICLRDPSGGKPLSFGRLNESPVVASETCAFDLLEADFIRQVEAGEMLVFSGNNDSGLRSWQLKNPDKVRPASCIFELVYYARPDSQVFGHNVYMARKNMGMQLAAEGPVEADMVMPFPDSGVYCAVGFAQASGLPYEHALIRNHYVGRTFIQPTQDMRDFSVRVKLNPVREALKGKRVVIVDDSIVRGTTMRTRVKKLRELGAREVHCRISCPPVAHPCFYGVDFPSRGELIASSHDVEEIRRYMELDTLVYLSMDGLLKAAGNEAFCHACFTGDYPIPTAADIDSAEKRRP